MREGKEEEREEEEKEEEKGGRVKGVLGETDYNICI